MLYTALIFLLKIAVIFYVSDAWLYWTHRMYHSPKSPTWLRKIHDYHHSEFLRTQIFKLHWLEWIIAASLPVVVVSYLISPWFCLFSVPWSAFEAARGHNHFKWFRIIPKGYYKSLKFCGIRYHMYHHEVDQMKNFGQMLKLWDIICKTRSEVKHA